MAAFDLAILVLQLSITAIAGVIAAVTRTRQEYNEVKQQLEEFPNPNSPWPLILVALAGGLLVSAECSWALSFPREHALLFLAILLLQVMAVEAAANRVLAGFA